MSRGGFRGRGRGGGRGGGGIGPGGKFEIPGQSDMSKQEWSDLLFERSKHSGMLYPPLEAKLVAHLPGPSTFEEKTVNHSISLSNHINNESIPNAQHKVPTPWRLVNSRKIVGIEIETWSDRLQPATSGSGGASSSGGSSRLDAGALYLDKSLFPPILWAEVFEGEEGEYGDGKRRAGGKGSSKKRMRITSPDGDEDEGDQPDQEDKSQAGSQSDVDDFDFEDDEEDHQDYDANYFDNGEGDDDDEGGGDEDGDGGGNDYD